MVDIYPQDDPNHVFPTLDGIAPPGPPDVPPGFDLVQILSGSMRARPQWRDLAAAASRVIYEYVERTRLALQMAREPAVLSRTLKISTLRMIGLDWNSQLLSDDDYDRVLDAAALFMQDHGPQDFARFMGYALGVPLDIIPLWTRDHAQFFPGRPLTRDTIFDGPDGTAYPTAHVDLVFDLFAKRTADILGAREELERVFYHIAPIHLVLDWIAAQITLSIGTLYLVPGFYKKSEQSVVVENPNEHEHELVPGYRKKSMITAVLQPDHPYHHAQARNGVVGHDVGVEAVACQQVETWFRPGYNLNAAGITVNAAGGWVPSLSGGVLRSSLQPDPGYVDPLGSTGLLVLPATQLYVNNPTLPRSYTPTGCSVDSGPLLPDSNSGYVLNGLVAAGYLSVPLPNGTQCVSFAFRPHGSAQVRLTRGTQWAGMSVNNGAVTVTSEPSVTDVGYYPLGNGYYVLWAVLTGDLLNVSPGYDVSGVVDWLTLQAEPGLRPSPQGPRVGSGGIPYSRAGTEISVNPHMLNAQYGSFVMRLRRMWTQQPLCVWDALTSTGDRARLDVSNGVAKFVTSDGALLQVPCGTNTDVALNFSWSPSGTTLMTPTSSQTANTSLLRNNYVSLSLASAQDAPPSAVATLRTCLLIGGSGVASLPSTSVINALLTQGSP